MDGAGEEGFDARLDERDILEVVQVEGSDEPDGDSEMVVDGESGVAVEVAEEEGVDDADSLTTDEPLVEFSRHAGDVFCAAIHGEWVATGGEDDRAFVWRRDSGALLFDCDGHGDSVVQAAFNKSGSLLATADLAATVALWSVPSGECVVRLTDASADLQWLCWHPVADILFAGDGEGSVWMWLIGEGGAARCKVFGGRKSACTAAALVPGAAHLVAGYADGSLLRWHLKAQTAETLVESTSDSAAVTVVASHPTQQLAVAGREDGAIVLCRSDVASVLAWLSSADGQASVECACFCAAAPWLATGDVDGRLVVWHVTSAVARVRCEHPAAVVRAIFLDERVLSACLDGRVRLWDARDGQIIFQLRAHAAEIFDLAFCAEDSTIVTAAGDKTARLFHLDL